MTMSKRESTTDEIPSEMRRLVVMSPGTGTSVKDCTIAVESIQTPKPSSGEVLIKVVAAPVNPSDYGSWMRGSGDDYPMPMGKEGSGIVVATNGYLAGFRFPVGTKVGFVVMDTKQGSYSEYVTANTMVSVFSMPQDKPIEDCASFFVNPYTACGILDTAKTKSGSTAIVHTAAASQLGQMLNKLAPSEGMQIINVVRREEQADLLKGLGAEHVIVTNRSGTWKKELKTKIRDLGATCAFDAVAGDTTGALVEVLPDGGTCYVYGGLSKKHIGNVNPLDLVYRNKKIQGFLLNPWIENGGFLAMIHRLYKTGLKVNSGVHGGWCSSEFQDTTIEKTYDDILALIACGTNGKKLRVRFDA